MRTLLFAALLLPAVLCSDVLDFTDSNFSDEIKKHEFILVEFFAPWCGHCKRLAPEYENAATILKNNDPPIALAKVDCIGDGKGTCDKFSVSGFPTLKIFRNGEVSADYEGPREANGIVKYLRSKAGPVSKELTSAEQLEKMLHGDEAIVVGFFSSMDSDAGKEFLKAAGVDGERFRFAHTSDKAIAGSHKFDSVVLHRTKKFQNKFEDKTVTYDGEMVQKKLKAFLDENAHGLVGLRNANNLNDFEKPLVVVHYKIDLQKDPKGFGYWRNRVLKIAKTFKEAGKQVNFAVSNLLEMSHELSEFGMEDAASSDKPVAIARDALNKKFKMDAEWSLDAFEKFVNSFLDGELEPHMKSEPVPETNDEPVKVVVAKNFDEIVNDPSKDVLIEFYAPWCGHCKNLAPKYDELGKKLQKESGVVIAKMDATANDVPPQYQVQGFPTIYFAPKNSKMSPKQYQGGREVKDFIEYLAKEATDELSGYNRKGKKTSKKEEL